MPTPSRGHGTMRLEKTETRSCFVASVDQRIVARTRRVHRPTDARINRVELYFLPVATRVPLKFGSETLTTVTSARVRIQLIDRHGKTAEGWGETPLSVQWSWPGGSPYGERAQAVQEFCAGLTELWADLRSWAHPIETGHDFLESVLPGWLEGFNRTKRRGKEP